MFQGLGANVHRVARIVALACLCAVGSYADGCFVTTLNGHRYIWHDGAIGGFQTMNATFPDDGIDIIVLTNDGTGLDPYFIIPQLFAAAQTL